MKSDGNPDTLEFYVTQGYGNDGCLKIYMSPEIANEARTLFSQNGLTHSRAVEFSAEQELVIASVAVLHAGGLVALERIIRILVHRHDGKEFRYDRDSGTVEAKGYSKKDVMGFLEKTAEKQAVSDAKWQKELDALEAREAAADDQQPDQ